MHGIAPGPKPDEVTRLIYENPDRLSTKSSGNENLEKTKEIINELEADVAAFVKHNINYAHKEKSLMG